MKHKIKTAETKKLAKKRLANVHVVCPDCGFQTCICELKERSRIKKSRHKMQR